ncbi:MAG: DegT/DnrJ/EryC1/StrS family aminotransferase [bacterium]|nr:DegT/DnrJ/EryC1/StrS family aminotransferase [bacterium]
MKKIRLSKCAMGPQESQNITAVLGREFLGMGDTVREFEEALSQYLNGRSVAVLNSGTAALHLALQGCGIGSGDEVLVPSLTYVASFQAISASGATPVACEVNSDTGLIDLGHAAMRLSEKTKAIMPVHYAGNPGNLSELYDFANAHHLRVIEDAAHAFGGTYKGKKIGAMGDIVCFSFDGIKNITSGEGGCVVTEDETVLQCIKDARLLGVERDTEKRYSGARSWEFDVSAQGYRYHMSNLFAAIGLVQLTRLDSEFAPRRQKIATQYVDGLAAVSGLRLFPHDYSEIVPHIFPIRVMGNQRDALRTFLIDSNVEVGIHYQPNHRLSYFKDDRPFPNTDALYSELLTLPLHVDLSDDEQNTVISLIHSFFSHV